MLYSRVFRFNVGKVHRNVFGIALAAFSFFLLIIATIQYY